MESKKCSECLTVKTLHDFPLISQKKLKGVYHRKQCKPCHSKRVYFDEQMRKMTRDPDNWLQCEDCCQPISKRKKFDGKCPKCGSLKVVEANI